MQTEDETTPAGPRTVTLCGGQGCCPTVTIDERAGSVVLKDDFGGQVTLTLDEWRAALAEATI